MSEEVALVDTKKMERMIHDALRGIEEVPGEDEEHRRVRRAIKKDVDEIVAKGGIVDIPFEIPDITED